jgi:hypothetical protein
MRLKPHSNRFKRLRAAFGPRIATATHALYINTARRNNKTAALHPNSARAKYQKAKSLFKHGMAR